MTGRLPLPDHVAELAAKHDRVFVRHVSPFDENAAAIRVEKAVDELQGGRSSRTRRAVSAPSRLPDGESQAVEHRAASESLSNLLNSTAGTPPSLVILSAAKDLPSTEPEQILRACGPQNDNRSR